MRYLIPILLLFPLGVFAAEKPTPKEDLGADLSIVIGSYNDIVTYSTYSKWTNPASSLIIDKNYNSEIENIDKCPENSVIFCDLYFSQRDRYHLKATSTTSIDQIEIKKYLEDLARKTDSDPTDATFSIENGQVSTFSQEQDGHKLNIEKSLEVLVEIFLKNPLPKETLTATLPFETTKSKVTTSEINNLGISTLIGQGSSNFKGSPANRIHNIKTAVARFKGILIKPGEEFSFVKVLGDVDAERGYLPELVIKKDKTEPEFGGGICQVSTTAFRAALYSGLEITARRNHAYAVSYYSPVGMDSTIYIPKPDLRFMNNTPSYILIQPEINGTELIFNFYGTDDGRKTEIETPIITESNPDKSMKTVFTQKVTRSDGSILINDTFRSSYDSPYKYPHPGDAMLSAKPENWNSDEWDVYKKAYKEANPTIKKKK
jgi:vancomycin resistance protein YoaR